MAHERDHITGIPRDYRVSETGSTSGLLVALVIVVALVIGAIALFSGGPATESVSPPVATEPAAPPAVPDDAMPSMPAPDAGAPAIDEGAGGAIGDPAVPGIPPEDAAPVD